MSEELQIPTCYDGAEADAYRAGYEAALPLLADEAKRALLAEAEWLRTAHANSHDKGYSSEYRKGFLTAAGWVKLHAKRAPGKVASPPQSLQNIQIHVTNPDPPPRLVPVAVPCPRCGHRP